jgi:competence protein ComEC
MAQVGEAGASSWGAGRRAEDAAPWPLLGALVRNLEAEQERWFLWLPVLFGAGIALYFSLPVEPLTSVALLPVAAALALHAAGRRHGTGALISAALLALACGVAAAKLRTEAMRAPVLQGQVGPVEVTGFIELIEPRPVRGQRLTIRVASIDGLTDRQRPLRVRVRAATANGELRPGDAIRIWATLTPPPWPSLPGDYDFARAAWFHGLGAVGYAAGAAAHADLDTDGAPLGLRLRALIERVRQAIGRRIGAVLPGETGAIANALITGERGGIPEATNQAFRDSGLFHILSISGLHMVIMAGAVFFLIRLSLAAIPAVALRYPIKKWAAVGAMLGALAYLLISGAAFATVRSYIMISIMFLAVLLDRPAVALRNVALAALAILLIWPESLFDPGFQMSFAAVVSLVSAYEWLRTRHEQRQHEHPGGFRHGAIGQVLAFLGGIVTSTLVAGLAVAPFGIYHFHNTQQFAILANLLAIPICNLLVMPAGLAALIAMPFGLEATPLRLMGIGIDAMTWCATNVAALPGAVGRLPAIPAYAFVAMVAGGLWCTLWGTRWRLLGVIPIALGLMLAPTGRRPDVLIGRNAELVAVRGQDGALSALMGRGSTFELARWLEHDGDGRTPAEAAKTRDFRCDAEGCAASVKGLTVAVPGNASALRDDCAKASILVLKATRPRGCTAPAAIVGARDVLESGAHALYIEDGRVHIDTVAAQRGRRPWSTPDAPAATDALADEEWPRRGSGAQ